MFELTEQLETVIFPFLQRNSRRENQGFKADGFKIVMSYLC